MPLKDPRKLTEPRPDDGELQTILRKPKSRALMFSNDGIVPNHPRWPTIIHRRAAGTAALIDRIFESNGCGRSWRDSIYDFVHYHSQIHEVFGVARGEAVVQFGGVKGKRLRMAAGEIAISPAGTGHRLVDASRNFLVVGAYPKDGTYDECTDSRDRPEAVKRIAKVKKPSADPVFGRHAGVPKLWKAR